MFKDFAAIKVLYNKKNYYSSNGSRFKKSQITTQHGIEEFVVQKL